MEKEKKSSYRYGRCGLLPLERIRGDRSDLSTSPELFHLWIVEKNQAIPSTDIASGDLNQTLCFFPTGSLPALPHTYLQGFGVWFDHGFVDNNAHLKRFSRLLQAWSRPMVTIRRQEAWFAPILAVCQIQQMVESIDAEIADTYQYLHCTLIGNYLFDLLNKTMPWLHLKSEVSPLLQAFLEMVEQHFFHEHGTKFYASELLVSESALYKRCRQELRQSPGEVIHFRLIKEAKYLLSRTSLNNKEIAARLNFSSPAYFCERFKEATSLTPQAFRSLNKTRP